MLRVAIIGAGRIGRVHAESVASHPKATLVAVCDPMGTAAEDLAAMQVVVVSQLSRTYFQLRGWQEQLRITQENADNQARTLQLLEVRLKAGMATPFDVDRGRTQLESTRARIPSLEADIAVARLSIAMRLWHN